MNSIVYETAAGIDVDELVRFYERQGHPIPTQRDKISRMVESSFCFVTARRNGELVGIARAVTDGVYAYLSECKLDPRFQGPAAVTRTGGRIEHDECGIAREMACRVIDALRSEEVDRIFVMGYGTEVDFCEELGFKRIGGTVALSLDVAPETVAMSDSR